ncbi:hypothetical protein JRO89_XSUnG0065700 [Xanthoceras sorbifolium]|uniref:Uncharacterized protein n=1 Tax=Xanthoceras sorbifolium TaxID=99658 RepID=A0ABQ8GZP6_9ROSI|nr:hypothetical protein JRO89_XSUnG0065700 [Xanthoceras sorbifolium]
MANYWRSRPHSFFEPQANFMALGSQNFNNNWVLDLGASHHITSDLQNLSIHSEYGGNDDIRIGNGSDNGGNARSRPE